MLAVLPKLVYLLTLGPFHAQTLLGTIPLVEGAEGESNISDTNNKQINLPASSSAFKIDGKDRRSALTTTKSKTKVQEDWWDRRIRSTADEIPQGRFLSIFDVFGWSSLLLGIFALANPVKTASIVVSSVGLLITGLFYFSTEDKQLVYLLKFSSVAFLISIHACLIMFSSVFKKGLVPQEMESPSPLLILSTTAAIFGAVTLITAFLTRIHWSVDPRTSTTKSEKRKIWG